MSFMKLRVFGRILSNDTAAKILKGDKSAGAPLIEYAEAEGLSGDIPRAYIMKALAEDENALTLSLARARDVGEGLRPFVISDLRLILQALKRRKKLPAGLLNYSPAGKNAGGFSKYKKSLLNLSRAENAAELFDGLKAHLLCYGGGRLAKYLAYRWSGGLVGLENPSLASFDDLYGLREQKKRLIENTRSFLDGKPANHALLYGGSGTGKSSCVKALAPLFCLDGLRICELPAPSARELPLVMAALGKMPLKYIIFMDDLSFESGSDSYKDLKRVVDGRLEDCPHNILIYITSNRRHLVRQKWEDREGETAAEVHAGETMQEIHSLAERFGLQIFFPTHSQSEYLEIVEALIENEGLAMTEEIKQAAIRWEMHNSHRSGRAARQFVKWLRATPQNPPADF